MKLTESFTIKSDAGGTGSFIPKNLYTNNGSTKIEQYLSTLNWHYVGSSITTANGIYANSSNTKYYYSWNETVKDRWLGNDFVDWADGVTPNSIMGWTGASGVMNVAEGYAFLHKTPSYNATFTGEFNNGIFRLKKYRKYTLPVNIPILQ